MALGGILPVGDFANPLMQIGAGALRGAAIGALSGGIASVIGGGSFGAGAAYGAMGGAQGGAISGFYNTQQFKNWQGGNGFRSNADVRNEQRKLANMQEMLDNAYAEGGIEGRVRISVDIVSVTAQGGSISLYDTLAPLGKIGITLAGGIDKTAFPLACATAKVGGATLLGITLGTDVATLTNNIQSHAPAFTVIHGLALTIADGVSMASNFGPPGNPYRWTALGAHVWDTYTQDLFDRYYGNK